MGIITQAWQALKAGEELTNSAVWKNRQATTNSLVAIIGLLITAAGCFGYDIKVSDEDIAVIATSVAIVLGLCNSYFTTATSKKVGLAPKVDP